MALRRAGKGYVLGVGASHRFNSWIGKLEVGGTAEEIADDLDPAVWQRLSAGTGTKGERLYEWAYCESPTWRPMSTPQISPGPGRVGS